MVLYEPPNPYKLGTSLIFLFSIFVEILHMSENAEDAYWPNLVSFFRVTSGAYCDFLSNLYGTQIVPIISPPKLNHVLIKFALTGCPENCLI